MAEREEDLGLSLSLGYGGNSITNNTKTHSLPNPRTSWNHIFNLPDPSSGMRSFLRGGIDVNLAPPTPSMAVDCGGDEENGGVSSPNSTISSISGKRSEREPNGDEHDVAERTSCSRGSDDEDGDGGAGGGDDGGGETSRKKLRLSKEQAVVLEETFKEHNTLNPKQKQALAKQLNLRPRQVEVWFQNRRARTKLKQTEVDCEYLKRCCDNLTEENRRLQKEVQELRALKSSPQLYMHMNPPTTLTMCPSCERVAVSSSSSSSSTATTTAPSGVTLPPPLNRNPLSPNIQRPIPVNPWAAMLVQHRRP